MDDIPVIDAKAANSIQVSPVDIVGPTPVNEGVKKAHVDDAKLPMEKWDGKRVGTLPFKLFTLAPVYAVLGVPFSIPQQYVTERGADAGTITTFEVDFKIFDCIDGWNNRFDAIDPKYWEDLCYFLAQCGFTKGGKVWALRKYDLKLPDAMGVDTFDISVFTPATEDTGVMAVADQESGIVKLYSDAGAQRAKAMAELGKENIK